MANEIKGIRVNGVPYKVNYPDLANKIAGDEQIIPYIPEQTVTLYQDGDYYVSDLVQFSTLCIPGWTQNYIVTINNKEYRVEANGYDGDINIFDGDFYLGIQINSYSDSYEFQVGSNTLSGNVKIKVDLVNYSPISTGCLPYLHKFGAIGEPYIIIPEQSVTFENEDNTTQIQFDTEIGEDSEGGTPCEYIVTFDGVKYYCKARQSGEFVYLESEMDGPFAIPVHIEYNTSQGNYGAWINSNEQQTHTLKVECVEVMRMSSKLLPYLQGSDGSVYTVLTALNRISELSGLSLSFSDR